MAAAHTFKQSLPILLLRSMRPRQWIKNIALYAALIFSGFFFYVPGDGIPYAATTTYAVIVFSILTSSIYLINDIVDKDADAAHPFKKKRPIASGELSVPIATGFAAAGLLLTAILSFALPIFFQLLLLSYLALQIVYAKRLKHLPIFDVASIALGFLIRIYAGAVVVNLHMSVWFLLTVISASLFLAVGKRQSERTLLAKSEEAGKIGSTRKILRRYSQRLLDQFTAMFATATWLTYALFAFQHESSRPASDLSTFYSFLPRTLQSQKLLMLSLPFVIFGIMRYLQLVYESNEGESPERVLLKDKPLLATVLGFGLVIFVTIYLLGA